MIASPLSRGLRRGSGLALALLVCVCACAEDDETYRLGVGDEVSVQVLYHPDFSVPEATVRPDGRVNVPVAGDVVFAGRTVAEVGGEIAEALTQELRDPRVSVRLVRRHVEPIYVLGAVRSPGALEVREPVSIAEAIALAEGLSATAAPRWATLIDADGRERRIDVLAALQGAEAEARRIAPGETLLVSAQYLVTVVGQVAEPGRYPTEDGDRVGDALAAAGGLAEDAAQTGTLLRADGAQMGLDLEALVERGEGQANLALAAGDTIVIPPARRRVALVGAFAEPGKYDFDPGDRVSDALALARDVADDALPASALLLRDDGTSQRLDIEALLQTHEGAEDPELRDGDTLVLPRATERVAVVGMVANPGPLPLEPGMTAMDAIAAAGGWEQEAHPEKSVLWRQTDSGPEMTRVNARKLMRGAEGEANPALEPADIIYVPRDPSMTREELSRLLLGVAGLLRIAF